MTKQTKTLAAAALAVVLALSSAGWAGEAEKEGLTRAEAKAAVQAYLSERGLDDYRMALLTRSGTQWAASLTNRRAGPGTPSPTLTIWRAETTAIKALAGADHATVIIDDSELTPG